jgi:hypothetical protein
MIRVLYMPGKHCRNLFVRILVAALLLASATTLYARGRARGYQAGAGAHRPLPKLRAKAAKDKQKKPVPPPEVKPYPPEAQLR